MADGILQFMQDQSELLRQWSCPQDGVVRRAAVCRSSTASDTSSGAYSSYSSVYSTSSSLSDFSAAGPNTEFDVTGSTVIAPDSDVEDGFTESSSVDPVSLTCALLS